MTEKQLLKIKEIKAKLERQYNSAELYPNDRVLSSSQISLILKDREEFIERYIVGTQSESLAMIIGVLFSEYYAGNEDAIGYLKELEVEDFIIKRLIDAKKQIVKAQKFEEELRVQFKGYTIRITLDGLIENPLIVIENKTGKTEWNSYRVEDDVQLDLQAWGIYKIYKKAPRIILNWVDLNKNTQKPIIPFEAKRTVAQIKEFEKEKLIPLIEGLEDGSYLI